MKRVIFLDMGRDGSLFFDDVDAAVSYLDSQNATYPEVTEKDRATFRAWLETAPLGAIYDGFYSAAWVFILNRPRLRHELRATSSSEPVHVCCECGSTEVQHAMWVELNTDTVRDPYGSWCGSGNSFCAGCSNHVKIKLRAKE